MRKPTPDRNLSRLSENPILVGDSRELDFTIRKGILKADFLKKRRKKWDRIPTFHNFSVDKIRKLLINTKCEGGGGTFSKKEGNHE